MFLFQIVSIINLVYIMSFLMAFHVILLVEDFTTSWTRELSCLLGMFHFHMGSKSFLLFKLRGTLITIKTLHICPVFMLHAYMCIQILPVLVFCFALRTFMVFKFFFIPNSTHGEENLFCILDIPVESLDV